MGKKYLWLMALISCSSLGLEAQYLRQGQIDPGKTGTEFRISEWTKGTPWSEDDNFFISRVKPKARFTNTSTQINQKLKPWWDWDYESKYSQYKDYSDYSKKILNWFPYGFSYTYPTKSPFEILPNGIYNSEVFTMWQYISTWGAWSDKFMRLPGNFADVAHKNGVAVATQSTTAFGADMSTCGWGDVYIDLGATEENRNKVIEFLDYYGIDGIGYNSEFAGGYSSMGVPEIVELNKAVSKHFQEKYSGEMRCFSAENIWYDGVTLTGGPTFDNGVCPETEVFFGDADNIASSYFLNYNWNANFNNGNNEYLPATLEYAANTLKRNPFDVYATFDLQGGSPKLTGDGEKNGRWQYLDEKAVSIGLWSGHDSNTFWENRFLYGSKPLQVQQTYQQLLERWFTNSHFNPVYAIDENLEVDENIDNSLDTEFFGLSKFVAAQSTLCWNLSDEPFVTHFNLGNGEYFNWQGKRQHDKEWFNIGVQDYLPTWRWWWANQPLSRDFANVPTGLRAECAWNEAWFGGSSLRISGTESARAVLHLFKTKFDILPGDVITVRYKLAHGHADCSLMLGYGEDCSSWNDAKEYCVIKSSDTAYPDWQVKQFVVDDALQLALIALQFENASDLDVNIGEISIRRGDYSLPDMPEITSVSLLATHMDGVDAKVIFDMNTVASNRQGHYNIDHVVSLYKIYAKIIYPDSETTTLMGCTTSWAALFYSAPYDAGKAADGAFLQIGVSAVGLDMNTESAIAWSEPLALNMQGDDNSYYLNDKIEVSEKFVCDGSKFSIGYVDPLYPAAQEWTLIGPFGNSAFATPENITIASTTSFDAVADVDAATVGLQSLPYGFYDLSVKEGDGTTRRLHSFLHIYDDVVVGQPEITEFTAVDSDLEDDAISEVTEQTAAEALLTNFPDDRFIIVDAQGREHDLRTVDETLPGAGIKLRSEDTLTLRYEAAQNNATGNISAGANLRGYSLSTTAEQAGIKAVMTTTEEGESWEKVTIDESDLSFSVAFWVKITDLNDPTWLLNIRNPKDAWPYSAWGWLWGTISEDGYLNDISIRSHANNSYLYDFRDENGNGRIKFEKDSWYHIAYVFDEYKMTESSYYGIITTAENQFSLYINGELISPTSISEPKDKGWKDFDPNALISIGGTAAVGSFAGYEATIDNLQFYNTTLDREGVLKSMADIENPNLVDSMTALWDFEGENPFANKVDAYSQAILSHNNNASMTLSDDVITPGYPGLKANLTYDVKLRPELTVAGAYAEIIQTGVDDNQNHYGIAEVTFPDPGENTYKIYTAQLCLDNDVAKDEAEYAYIYVVNIDGKLQSGIVGAETDCDEANFYPNPIVDKLNVSIKESGKYTLQLVNMEGKIIASQSKQMDSDSVMILKVDCPSGVYVAILLRNGAIVGTSKIVKGN